MLWQFIMSEQCSATENLRVPANTILITEDRIVPREESGLALCTAVPAGVDSEFTEANCCLVNWYY